MVAATSEVFILLVIKILCICKYIRIVEGGGTVHVPWYEAASYVGGGGGGSSYLSLLTKTFASESGPLTGGCAGNSSPVIALGSCGSSGQNGYVVIAPTTSSCSAGSYFNMQSSACVACPAGSTSSAGAYSCSCNAGYTASGYGDGLVCSGMLLFVNKYITTYY